MKAPDLPEGFEELPVEDEAPKPNGKAEDWPEPLDLFAEHLAAPAAIGEDCLPATILRHAVSEGRRLGVDPVGIAAGDLFACSVVLSDTWRVRLKVRDTTWGEQPRLWVAIVGEPGKKKTAQIQTSTAPLRAIAWRLRKRHEQEMAKHLAALEEWDKLPKKERGPKPKPPAERRVMTQDATVEALSELLKADDDKVGVVVDELAAFIGGLDRYQNGRVSANRAHALALYDGGPHDVDRISRGHVHVPNWSVCIFSGIQIEKLREIAGSLAVDGMLQRFTNTVPASVVPGDPEDDDVAPDRAAIADYAGLVEALHELRPPELAEGGPAAVRAAPEVTPERRQVFRLIERVEKDPMLPAPLRQTFAKMGGQLARIALVFHCVGLVEAGGEPAPRTATTLTAETVRMAANFVRRVVVPSTFKLYRELGLDGDPDARRVADFILARGLAKVTAYDVGHACRELRGDLQAIARAMDLLECAGWLRGDGHPRRPRWEVNPLVHAQFAARAEAERERRARAAELLKVRIADLAVPFAVATVGMDGPDSALPSSGLSPKSPTPRVKRVKFHLTGEHGPGTDLSSHERRTLPTTRRTTPTARAAARPVPLV